MEWQRPKQTTFALLAGLLMAAMALSGCMTEGGGMSFDSYEEAKSAPGPTYVPNNQSEGDRIMLKVLVPEDPQNVGEGEQPFLILLYDQEADAPVTDAEVEHESRHPSMGHAGGEEQDLTHDQYGVYEGTMNPIMPGDWVVNVDVYPQDGEAHRFQVEYRVA